MWVRALVNCSCRSLLFSPCVCHCVKLFIRSSLHQICIFINCSPDMTRLYESIFLATLRVHHELFILHFYERLCLLSPLNNDRPGKSFIFLFYVPHFFFLFSFHPLLVRVETSQNTQFGRQFHPPCLLSFLPSFPACVSESRPSLPPPACPGPRRARVRAYLLLLQPKELKSW